MKDWKRVGIRVKLARPKNPANLGTTGMILAVGTWYAGDTLPSGRLRGMPQAECVVKWDSAVTTYYGTQMSTPEVFDKLEPIIPEDCSTPSEYSLGELLDKLHTEEVCYL